MEAYLGISHLSQPAVGIVELSGVKNLWRDGRGYYRRLPLSRAFTFVDVDGLDEAGALTRLGVDVHHIVPLLLLYR